VSYIWLIDGIKHIPRLLAFAFKFSTSLSFPFGLASLVPAQLLTLLTAIDCAYSTFFTFILLCHPLSLPKTRRCQSPQRPQYTTHHSRPFRCIPAPIR
jgi:hypothetical protein